MRINSVNLGGWFVLEYWMKPELFKETKDKCHDETCFSIQTPNFEEKLQKHQKTWITKEDILWLKEKGINLVRIPIPWWLYGEGVYMRSIEFLDETLEMINEVGMDFMLDIHTAPGCQNGFDNGGIQHVIDWPKDPKNIDKTIEVLVSLVERYKGIKHFHSIQLLNEPHISISLDILKDFYLRSYNQIREVDPDLYIVMHDGFRLNAWEEFFKSNPFTNVILDTHQYHCFDSSQHRFTIEERLEEVQKRIPMLEKVESYVPVLVGEWSLGLRGNDSINNNYEENLKRFCTAQLESFKNLTGHTFWAYKITEFDSGWNFRALVERGIIDPKEFTK
ncbi:cellulase family glycosylhydrolase [Candidatus Izimaplasma bacterium]|nr:cellulase family glycosylhydrolase [Candidatus Izimaplasma bacterium]